MKAVENLEFRIKNLELRPALHYIIIAFLLCAAGSLYSAGKFYGNGSRSKKQVSITFDDGPGPATREILDILDTHNVKAAFFMLGEQVERRPAIAQEVYSRGHEVCNHTFHHKNFRLVEEEKRAHLLKEDIRQCAAIITDVTEYRPPYVRIPYGYYRSWIDAVTKELDVDVVHWTFGCDWKKLSEEEMIQRYLDAVRPGAILLFHDGGSKTQRKKTLAILPHIIEHIRSKDYSIVPLSRLLGHQQQKVPVK